MYEGFGGEHGMIQKINEEMKARLIKEFLDLLILRRLIDVPSSGHDLTKYIMRKYMVYLSPGVVYSTLYSLERKGFVEAKPHVKKRIYWVNGKGENLIKKYQTSLDGIVKFAENFFRQLAVDSGKAGVIIER